MVTNILLAAILGLILAFACVLCVVLLRVLAFRQSIIAFFSPPEANAPSPFALLMDAISSQMARAMAAQMKTTAMGLMSGAKRAQQAVEGDIAEGLAGTNPLMAGAMSLFPGLKKTLRRNPQLVDLALSQLQKRGMQLGLNHDDAAKAGNNGDGAFAVKG